MSKTRTDAMELAVAMKNMYKELTPDLAPWVEGEMTHWLYKSILGEAHGLWESYAAQMIYWLEENIKMKQYRQFKAVQQGLIEFGVIPGPRKERADD